MPNFNTYLDGNLVVLRATFTDVNGNPVDPDAVVCKLKLPSSAVIELQVARSDTGKYEVQYSLVGLDAGTYIYRWEGNGRVQAASWGQFCVVKTVGF